METGIVMGAVVIYGLVGGLKSKVPQVSGIYAWGLSLALGVVFGYLQVFGLESIEAGIVASLGMGTANTLVNKIGNK